MQTAQVILPVTVAEPQELTNDQFLSEVYGKSILIRTARLPPFASALPESLDSRL